MPAEILGSPNKSIKEIGRRILHINDAFGEVSIALPEILSDVRTEVSSNPEGN